MTEWYTKTTCITISRYFKKIQLQIIENYVLWFRITYIINVMKIGRTAKAEDELRTYSEILFKKILSLYLGKLLK